MDSQGDSVRKLKKKKKKMSGGKIAVIVLVTILAIMIIAIAACMAVLNHYLNLIPKIDKNGPSDIIPPSSEDFESDNLDTLGPGETRDPDLVEETTAPEEHYGDITWPDDPEPVNPADDGLTSILIVGQDRRPGQSRQRSDSMMVITINTKKGTASVVSFLRDTYVQIPGYSDNRLNVAYKFGGFPLLKNALYKNFGVSVDGCFECDFDDFKEIIDYLGGVEINVTEKEARHMRNYLHVNVSAGRSVLTGEQALAYARIRKIDNDFYRTNRQWTILKTLLFDKFKKASISELNEIANTILPKLVTDMTNSEIIDLMTKVFPLISSIEDDSIQRFTVPYEGTYRAATIRKMQVLVPDLPAIRTKIANEMMPR